MAPTRDQAEKRALRARIKEAKRYPTLLLRDLVATISVEFVRHL
jgi:hypothetical protein